MEPAFQRHLRSLCYAGCTLSLPSQGMEWLRSQYLRHGLPHPGAHISIETLRPLYYRIGEPLTQATPISQIHTVYALALLGDEAGLEMLREDYGLTSNFYMQAYSRGLRKSGAGVQAVQILEAYFLFSTYQGLLEKAMVAVARLGLQQRFVELLAQLRVCLVPSRLRRLGCLESAFYLETLGTQYLSHYPPAWESFYQGVIDASKPPSDAVFEHLLVLFEQGRVKLHSFIMSPSMTAPRLARVLEIYQHPLSPDCLSRILQIHKGLPELQVLLDRVQFIPPLGISRRALEVGNAAAVTYTLNRHPELSRFELLNFNVVTRGMGFVDLPYIENDKALFAQYAPLLQRLVGELYHRGQLGDTSRAFEGGHLSLQSRLVLNEFNPEVLLSLCVWVDRLSGSGNRELNISLDQATPSRVLALLGHLVSDPAAWPALLALGFHAAQIDGGLPIQRSVLLNSLIFCAAHQPSWQLARLVSLFPSSVLEPLLNELSYACCLYNRPDSLQLLMDYFPDAVHEVREWETAARGCGHAELLEFVMGLPVGLRLGLEDVD